MPSEMLPKGVAVKTEQYLSGKLLIAMPDMADPRFRKSVVLMLFHSDKDAMGVVVNKIAGSICATQISDADEDAADESLILPLHDGGPVDPERIMVIHGGDGSEYPSTQVINEHFCMTLTPDIFEDLSHGRGPRDNLLILSYSGWAGGQLENEIASNAWLVCDASPKLVFRTESHMKWEAAIRSLGFSPGMLAPSGGSA